MYPMNICRNVDDIYVSDSNSDCVKKISNGKVISLKGIDSPVGVAILNGCLYTISENQYKIYQGEKFEHFAGSGEEGHKDGNLLEAAFCYPKGIVASNGSLYLCDRENRCIRRLRVFVEWSISNHSDCPKPIQDAVRTLMLMKKKRNNIWNGVPKDILFLISQQLGKIVWGDSETPNPRSSEREIDQSSQQKRQRIN
jgi:hypothetical protein